MALLGLTTGRFAIGTCRPPGTVDTGHGINPLLHGGVRIGQDDTVQRPTPLKKNDCADRSGALELQKTPPQQGVLVHSRTTILENALAK